jgi:hypothetical protein
MMMFTMTMTMMIIIMTGACSNREVGSASVRSRIVISSSRTLVVNISSLPSPLTPHVLHELLVLL